MKLNFIKMEGCGNDYIYIEESAVKNIDKCSLSKNISRRSFSIGADGLVVVGHSSEVSGSMTMFNADGSRGAMCGNALRCVAKYLYDVKKVRDKLISVATDAGVKTVELIFDGRGEVIGGCANMGTPCFDTKIIPVLHSDKTFIDRDIYVGESLYKASCVSVGNPHCVVFVEDVRNVDIQKIGPLFEHHKLFPDRINTEFIKIVDENIIGMRVWERGSGETLACGTGAMAAAVVAAKLGHVDASRDIVVRLKGGELSVKIKENGQVLLKGPATKTYEGSINYE